MEKSELLKDVLGFANAWRRSEAYILIGVKQVRGERSEVVGVDQHLQDHAIQQFINAKLNRPMRFRCEALTVEKKQVDVITVELQDRPFWLKEDYGKLRKDLVYVHEVAGPT